MPAKKKTVKKTTAKKKKTSTKKRSRRVELVDGRTLMLQKLTAFMQKEVPPCTLGVTVLLDTCSSSFGFVRNIDEEQVLPILRAAVQVLESRQAAPQGAALN
jgi:hypothetical protein